MARSLEPLVVGKVIGDVIDMFSPSAEMTVRYGTKQVGNGCEIKPSLVADKPYALIRGLHNPAVLYTLVCSLFLFIIGYYCFNIRQLYEIEHPFVKYISNKPCYGIEKLI